MFTYPGKEKIRPFFSPVFYPKNLKCWEMNVEIASDSSLLYYWLLLKKTFDEAREEKRVKNLCRKYLFPLPSSSRPRCHQKSEKRVNKLLQLLTTTTVQYFGIYYLLGGNSVLKIFTHCLNSPNIFEVEMRKNNYYFLLKFFSHLFLLKFNQNHWY